MEITKNPLYCKKQNLYLVVSIQAHEKSADKTMLRVIDLPIAANSHK